ncbi:MAG: hypothetical protein IKT25_06790 [Firmicutes bacterium]|nr:hypothetical protein [Bacillota bacterium]
MSLEQNERTRKALLEHCGRYPGLKIRDVFKYLYQSSFGCEHMVSSLDAVTDWIRKEYSGTAVGETGSEVTGSGTVDLLDGGYVRIHLDWLDRVLSAETLGKLFYLSAKTETEGRIELERKLDVALEMVRSGELAFSLEEFADAVSEWKEAGYPAVHHSEDFRKQYHPAYRVVAEPYVKFLPLFCEIDRRAGERFVVAIEGGSASGKTTLSQILSQVYDCTVFHMDDFFLRPEQRTPQRFAQPGGNVDRERFLEEVLEPLSRGEIVRYRRFDCSTFTLKEPVEVEPKQLVIVEGAYSRHPELAGYYDFAVFLDVSPELQRDRIVKRNGPEMAKRFHNEWIPMEQLYFKGLNIKEQCDLVLPIEERESL